MIPWEVLVGIPERPKHRLCLCLLHKRGLRLCAMRSEPCFRDHALPGTRLVGDKIFSSPLPQRWEATDIFPNSNKYTCSGQLAEDAHLKDIVKFVTLHKPLRATETKLSDKKGMWGDDCTSTQQWGRQEMLQPLRQQHDRDKQNEWNIGDPWGGGVESLAATQLKIHMQLFVPPTPNCKLPMPDWKSYQ